jgi:NAD+ synthase (glutamine-hydrolysing)
MLIGMAQINPTLGDFAGNREKILSFITRAQALNCDLVVFPEMTLMGYLPNDLLERSSIVKAQLDEFNRLLKLLPPKINVLLGLVTEAKRDEGKLYHNSVALLRRGSKPKYFHKELLPTYDVFDEARHIERGKIQKDGFKIGKHKVLLTICEDIWGWELPAHPSNYLDNPLVGIKGKYDLVINMSASPYAKDKMKLRRMVVEKTAKHFKSPVMYVNIVGAQDEVIFDGGSFVVDKNGKTLACAKRFDEDLTLFRLDDLHGEKQEKPLEMLEHLYGALKLGLQDYVRKTGFQKVHLGLSGGIDSAFLAALACDALGPENVLGITMPGPFNAPESKSLSEQLAKNLKMKVIDLPITDTYQAAEKTLHKSLGKFEFGLTNENLQARIRGTLLMAIANRDNSMLLSTSNKSEVATGYSTLYGDMCGGLAPLGDLLKMEVYELSQFVNHEREIIPKAIIDRAPSAELRPNQKDQDTLPPYPELDKAVENIVEKRKPASNETEKWLLKQVVRNEFKRWQSPPILRVTNHAFGRGRRMPIAHKAVF